MLKVMNCQNDLIRCRQLMAFLEVKPGEIVVCCPNGWQSTTIKSIAGLLRFEGQILINNIGTKVRPSAPWSYLSLRIYENLVYGNIWSLQPVPALKDGRIQPTDLTGLIWTTKRKAAELSRACKSSAFVVPY